MKQRLSLCFPAVLLLIASTFASAQETQPGQACSTFSNAQTCSQHNYCCFDQPSSTCFSAGMDDDFDCALLKDQNACSAWTQDCSWSVTNNRCQRLLVNSHARCQIAWGKRQTPGDNTYCWGVNVKQGCIFPFEYNGVTYNQCASVSPPSTKTGTTSSTWCATGNGKVSPSTNWDYCACTEKKRPKSVMLLILDDLRTELTAYGRSIAKTPNIDALSSRPGSAILGRAYTLFSLCAPSRASFLSGLSPDYTHVINSYSHGLAARTIFRKTIKTIPQIFRENGYYSAGGGKVFHLHHDDPLSWNNYYFQNRDQNKHACTTDRLKTKLDPTQFINIKFACQTRTPEGQLLDFQLARKANMTLDAIVMGRQEPFFLAVGIFKPHIPFHANIKYWNLYRANGIPDAERILGPDLPSEYTVRLTFDLDSELKSPLWAPDNTQQKKYRRTMRYGFMAALSQSDAVVGGLLGKLNELKLADSTLIVFMGDNGISLGEVGMYGKDTNFDITARVPLILYAPWLVQPGLPSRMNRLSDYFELTDLMPTLTSMMNVPLDPQFPYHGVNQAPRLQLYMSDQIPLASGMNPPRSMAFTQIYRCPKAQCVFTPLSGMNAVGYSVRTDQWRYTAYLRVRNGGVEWNLGILTQELYDHQNDQDNIYNYSQGVSFNIETTNVASQYPDVCAQLFQFLAQRYNVSYSLGAKLLVLP